MDFHHSNNHIIIVYAAAEYHFPDLLRQSNLWVDPTKTRLFGGFHCNSKYLRLDKVECNGIIYINEQMIRRYISQSVIL